MNHIIRTGALLCAFAMLSGVAVAEEKHLGDYIYVPAMTAPGSVGAISLRVSGARCGEDGQRVEEESLAGAEFGVYVVSSDGQLRPWANPLLPSEPMRIRTGEGETRFTLPQGTEFYLRQERAPQGYCYDREALIPVTGGDIVVNNEMAGELRVRVQDSLGNPLAGVTVSATNAAGEENLLITDENGAATMSVPAADTFAVREATLPEGVFDALAVYVGGAADSAQRWPSAWRPARRSSLSIPPQARCSCR